MRRLLLAAPVSIDLLDFEREAFIDEILKRTRLLFGNIDAGIKSFGIVDKDDPRTTLVGESSFRPFVVSVNATDALTIDISPGTAVFSTGEVIVLETGAARRVVAGGLGTQSVVYLKFSELETAAGLTRWDTLSNTTVDFLASDADYIKVSTRTDYESIPIAEADLTIPLALVTVQEVASGSGGGTSFELVIDHTSDSFSLNRPWFSPVDIQHRSYKGSGTASVSNPHAISLNDVSASDNQTLYQLQLDHGMIVSKDKSLAKVPGKLCVETILAAAITQDSGGLVTGISDAYWFRTTRFPTLVLRATNAKEGDDPDYAPIQINRTNRVFLLPNDEYTAGSDIEITYTTTDACEPSTDIPLTSIDFTQVANREAMISNGLVVNSITEASLTFADAGPIPQRFTAYLDSDGAIKKYPQTCVPYVKLTTIGSTLQTVPTDLLGLAPVKVALQGATPSLTLDVKVTLSGLDQYGSSVTETVEFNNTTWADNAAGTCTEEPKQFVYTVNHFSSLFTYSVDTNVDSGPASSIAIFGDITPKETEEISDILPVVDVLWDGLQVCEIEDIRPINTIMQLPRVTKFAGAAVPAAEGTLVYTMGTLFNFWLEDFDHPKFISTEWTDTTTLGGTPPPSLTDMSKIFDGLDLRDVYVGKPIAVKPHTSAPRFLRFIPIEPDRNFQLYARYFDGGGSWSPWTPSSAMTMPPYSLVLGGTTPLIKWQMAVSGQCKGMIVVYVVDVDPGDPPVTGFFYDVGVWDNGAYS